MLTTVTFAEEPGGKTKVESALVAAEATAEEQATFNAAQDSMQGGWSGTFERLDAYLAAEPPKA